MKVRIEFEDGDDCSSFNVVEFSSNTNQFGDDSINIAIETFLRSMNYYKPKQLIAELVEWHFTNGEDKDIDDAFAKVNLKITDATA